VQSLDAPAPNAPAVSDAPGQDDPPVAQEPTVVASMTPTLATARQAAGSDALVLRLTGDSWVQVVARDGRTIEKGLMSAGMVKSYPAADVGRVTLGNAAAVVVQRGDRALDTAQFQRANVARFTVSSDGSLAPVRD
jgi:cytoskeleton protein RodZ